ncbi:C1 family peptidase [Legionella sp. km772]|uniref:C1 family peptidase n=1 Tax=Legionella sp. km772 TaxID=2498111 RepID=UPI000F8C3C43|nr:C1 family peptidase [Legionella sp. km772]RUR13575.1 peptidase C1 [Legionella sp. km772]
MQVHKLLLLAAAFSTPMYAQDIKIVGTLSHSFKTIGHTHLLKASPSRSIKLLKVELSKPAETAISKRTSLVTSKKVHLSPSHFPSKVDLGMNNVPVLDQGSFGTCVTFASTAAINAALGQGDYVSQLCQLQLGNYLETNGYNVSGWDGSLGRTVLSQMESYGVVSKKQQEALGCGGLTEYPNVGKPIPASSISPEDYHQMSESINDKVSWSPILDIFTALDRVDTDKTLMDIKQALNEKDRVTFGVLLLDFDLGMMGAVGSHHSTFDTWILTPEIARDIYLRPMFGGHEMVITGYDDDAIATDEKGNQHKGLFTLRNSWGDKLGDKGNFYMSYDYFKVLVIEAQRIRTMPADGGVDSITA